MSFKHVVLSGKVLPSVGFGVFQVDGAEASRLVETALEAGYRHIDTAQYYQNEKEVGDGIRSFLKKHPELKREDIFLTSKTIPAGYEANKEQVRKSVEAIGDLGYFDLFLLHTSSGPRLEAYKVLQEFYDQGVIKNVGVSNFGIHHIKQLLEWPQLTVKPSVNQIEINPWLQRKELTDYCKANGIIVETFSPLMRGERLDDPALVALAEKYKKSTAQILIRWNLQKGFVPLPKSATDSRIKSNLDVFGFSLTDEEVNGLGDVNDYFVTWSHWDPVTNPL